MGNINSGTVFNIQRFAISDGPGIRTTVFLKGCPLNCIWCHNPESKSINKEIFYDCKKCLLCQKCAVVCAENCHKFENKIHSYIRENCVNCGACSDACVSGALETVGVIKEPSEVMAEVLKDRIFYDNSGGGLTLSGGEPMYQFEFAYQLLKLAKDNGLHVCLETCGFAKEETYKKIIGLVDIFLFDYKETDSQKHSEFTGVSNELILKNLKLLDDSGCKIILRCPIIPTFNDRADHFEGIAKIANSLKNIIEIDIEPYNPLGSGKADKLDKAYLLRDLPFPEEKEVEKWIEMISSKTQITVKKA